MHIPSPNIEEVMRFPKGISLNQNLEKFEA
jgi:hypothetical protein